MQKETMRAGRPTRVLLVDDDPGYLALLEKVLATAEYEVLTATHGREALRVLREEGVQLVVTDWTMPEMDGIDFCRAVRSAESLGFVYVIVLTAHADKARLLEAFDAGADDFLPKPCDRQELLARLRAGLRIIKLEASLAERNCLLHKVNAELAILNEKLERMATTDELTGLFNRRQAMSRLDDLWALARRYGQPLSCIMADIDHFKKFNDRHGHAAGDLVLEETASVLKAAARETDVVCRIGGEEFLVLCPNVHASAAAFCAERLRAAVASHSIAHRDGELRVTVSLGVAQRDEGITCPDDLLKAADGALYAAKNAGRNCVQVATGVSAQV